MSATAVGLAILGLLGLWVFGGFALRLAGVLVFISGAVSTASGHAGGIIAAALGVVTWLAGHWHYALRHQEYKSPLARHLFSRWPLAWLDPTRDWSVPVERGDGRRWSR
ncbi:MAG: hypothetical protein E6G51_06480 [Actinobacteria bacterium]|nr:MAG: hypothetical protein E6G51_06480 [Actinomycetota bacterium]